jgi:chemotaxis protein CheD
LGIAYVGIGELAVSKDPADVLKTMALGSCVGIMMYDPSVKAAGLLHVALPDSAAGKATGGNKPGRYADTGIPLLIAAMRKLGSGVNRNTIVRLAGGASMMDLKETFNIGKRNILAVKKLLWKHNLLVKAEDTGGSISRTVTINVDSGKIILSSPGRSKWEI